MYSNRLLGFFLVLFLFLSCSYNKSTEEGEPFPDYPDTTFSEIGRDTADFPEPELLDTSLSPIDTAYVVPPTEQAQPKSAKLGYSYPPHLKKDEVGDINVVVEIKNPSSSLKAQITKIVTEQSFGQNPKGDSIVIYSEDIDFYKDISISLEDDAGDFRIDAKHLNDTQAIDSIAGNRWHWTIIPITDKERAQLNLKVVAADFNGNAKVFQPKRIFIDIRLDHATGIRKLVNYLWSTPSVSIPILVSIFGFLGFLIRRKLGKSAGGEDVD